MFKKNRELLLLLIILAIAAFFRLWQLGSIPPGFYPDVAINGNDALNSLKTGDFKVFYPDNNGREGLFMWLIAASFSIFGVSVFAIKIVAAIIGILTVLGLYLLTKELFSSCHESGARGIALLASFFLSVSFWHTNFSRIGFRAILLPFILVFSFYFLFRALRTPLLRPASAPASAGEQGFGGQEKIWSFILAGVFFGLGFYTYTSFRMAVLILPFIFIPYWFIYKKQSLQKLFLIHTSYFLILTFLVALPLGIYFLQNPQDFISRATPVSIFAAENPLKEFGKSLILHLGMFNFYGDPNWRHNFSGFPMLFLPIGILFLIGLAFSIKESISSIKHKNFLIHNSYFMLLGWFFIMLLPGILTFEGIPHSLRVIGALPVVFIFAGLGAWKTFEFLNSWSDRKKLLIFTSLFFLLAIGVSEFNKYFFVWAKNPKVEEAFTKNYYDIGNYLNSLPLKVQKYVIVNELGHPLYGISIPAQTPMFIESTKFGRTDSTYLKFEDLDQIKVEQKKTVIIPLYDGRTFEELSKRFPGGKIKEEKAFQFYEVY